MSGHNRNTSNASTSSESPKSPKHTNAELQASGAQVEADSIVHSPSKRSEEAAVGDPEWENASSSNPTSAVQSPPFRLLTPEEVEARRDSALRRTSSISEKYENLPASDKSALDQQKVHPRLPSVPEQPHNPVQQGHWKADTLEKVDTTQKPPMSEKPDTDTERKLPELLHVMEASWKCMLCGALNEGEDQHCTGCGQELPPPIPEDVVEKAVAKGVAKQNAKQLELAKQKEKQLKKTMKQVGKMKSKEHVVDNAEQKKARRISGTTMGGHTQNKGESSKTPKRRKSQGLLGRYRGKEPEKIARQSSEDPKRREELETEDNAISPTTIPQNPVEESSSDKQT
ncbi:hypothetical protein EK21DRAFT_93708 [Setomelanomma holmii]|uniref:RanBP2-type domain-containing protein n=1 Tax=Setomelanomma holmii TaxID=210430 RepID=A0A9P4GZM3_9PLEO|nr:hypothetical protein EK21DRAFT_93708 [Setomelanomma holmii]